MKRLQSRLSVFLMAFSMVGCVLFSGSANAQFQISEADFDPPPTLEELQSVEREIFYPEPQVDESVTGKNNILPFDIRGEAIREAALSLGARGGLAWRTYEIRLELERRKGYMDKVFDFNQLLIPAPSGLMIEPPVISESLNAILINSSGQEAAVTDRFYDIIADARIVPNARTWRNYLEREWGDVDMPPDLLRPADDVEREIWKKRVADGWEQGIEQANDIFQADIDELVADYQGMVRYRVLLAQNMVSPPYALQVDRGVTGNGGQMRVGDRAIQITGQSELVTGSERWRPANR